ncbi:hypothetical protein JCM10207_002407 [Rhodosporidiobolus poonsookiae]
MHTRPPLPIATLALVLALAAAPSVQAELQRVQQHPARAGPSPFLDRRQLFGGLFGGDDDDSSATGTGTATDASEATSGGAASATGAGISIPSIGLGGQSSASSTPTATSASSTATSASTTASSTSSSSSPSSSSESKSSSASSQSQVIVTITSIATNADGSESTMLSSSASAVADKSGSGGGGGPSGKTWGIIGGVVGGVVVIAGLVLVIWRMTQRRFSDLDHHNEEIKWPELQPDGQTVSPGLTTLNPQGTRRTGGAGIEMEKDRFDGDDGSEWGEGSPRVGGGAGLTHGPNGSEFFDQPGGYNLPYEGGQRGSYYDPYLGAPSPANGQDFLGPSAAPYPPPNNIYPPPRVASPYLYADPGAGASNPSFSSPHLYAPGQSAEDMPLTAGAGGGAGIPYRSANSSPAPRY